MTDLSEQAHPARIAVFFGGRSPEYPVSLQSAYGVLCHLDRALFTPVPIGITRQGDWFLYRGDFKQIPADTWQEGPCLPAVLSPNPRDHALLLLGPGGPEKLSLDAAFPVLHGKNGEDGTLQGLLEMAGIPVAGCGVLSSALCMDKYRAHRLVEAEGISVPRSHLLEKIPQEGRLLSQAALAAKELGYPLFVKPLKAGSSFGVSRVKGPQELEAALRDAFSYDGRILLEENIEGFEVGCAVLGNRRLTLGQVDEIELQEGFFDYTEKYTLKTSSIHVPARIGEDTVRRVKAAARRIYRILDCRGFARVDLFLTPSGEIVFNEVNTIPGFTSHSRYPNMMQAAGISFEQVLTQVISLALGKEDPKTPVSISPGRAAPEGESDSPGTAVIG